VIERGSGFREDFLQVAAALDERPLAQVIRLVGE
jgi:hypothetical protein